MFAHELCPDPAIAQRRWRVQPGRSARSLRSVCLPLLAALALLGLMLAFQQVLRQAVVQGELRRQAHAALANATWRCNVQPERQRRESCLAQLATVPRDTVSLPARRVAAGASASTIAR